MKTIYLDNNATSKVAPEVLEEMQPYFCDLYGNPSSMHTFGGQVGHKLREARERVAALLGCDPTEIIFTGCGTESDNAAITGDSGRRPTQTKTHHHPRRASGGACRSAGDGKSGLYRHRTRR